ncbi:hypothetical protein POVWA2_009290 [Plasmodium ovale wallikeri]|uniref:Uncharacterized protein n=1 Tax=Plasmodium ovale wallikeri TaxID=864142 RepID=A0A1A8YLZ5_PLAOA|nr:hypothetical protein POVWA2_009290 [Plasmodium ovale wallikeri]
MLCLPEEACCVCSKQHVAFVRSSTLRLPEAARCIRQQKHVVFFYLPFVPSSLHILQQGQKGHCLTYCKFLIFLFFTHRKILA